MGKDMEPKNKNAAVQNVQFVNDSTVLMPGGNLTREILVDGNLETLQKFYSENKNKLTAEEEDYMRARINAAEKIQEQRNRTRDRVAQGKVPPTPEPDRSKDGFIGFSDLRGDGVQTSGNGCWSYSLAIQLKHRGVRLSQEDIRGWRPDQSKNPLTEEEKKEGAYQRKVDSMIARTNRDTPNSVFQSADLVHEVLPNTAVEQITLYQFSPSWVTMDKEDPDANEKRIIAEEYGKNLKAYLKETIRHALQTDRSPISFTDGSHYTTITGISEDGETLRYEDSRQANADDRRRTRSLDSLVESVMKDGAELSWLRDLPKPEYENREKEVENLFPPDAAFEYQEEIEEEEPQKANPQPEAKEVQPEAKPEQPKEQPEEQPEEPKEQPEAKEEPKEQAVQPEEKKKEVKTRTVNPNLVQLDKDGNLRVEIPEGHKKAAKVGNPGDGYINGEGYQRQLTMDAGEIQKRTGKLPKGIGPDGVLTFGSRETYLPKKMLFLHDPTLQKEMDEHALTGETEVYLTLTKMSKELVQKIKEPFIEELKTKFWPAFKELNYLRAKPNLKQGELESRRTGALKAIREFGAFLAGEHEGKTVFALMQEQHDAEKKATFAAALRELDDKLSLGIPFDKLGGKELTDPNEIRYRNEFKKTKESIRDFRGYDEREWDSVAKLISLDQLYRKNERAPEIELRGEEFNSWVHTVKESRIFQAIKSKGMKEVSKICSKPEEFCELYRELRELEHYRQTNKKGAGKKTPQELDLPLAAKYEEKFEQRTEKTEPKKDETRSEKLSPGEKKDETRSGKLSPEVKKDETQPAAAGSGAEKEEKSLKSRQMPKKIEKKPIEGPTNAREYIEELQAKIRKMPEETDANRAELRKAIMEIFAVRTSLNTVANSRRGSALDKDRDYGGEENVRKQLENNEVFQKFANLPYAKLRSLVTTGHGGDLEKRFSALVLNSEQIPESTPQRYMPTAKKRCEVLQKALGEVEKRSGELPNSVDTKKMLMWELIATRQAVGAQRGGKGLEHQIPVMPLNSMRAELANGKNKALLEGSAKEVRLALKGHGGAFVESVTKPKEESKTKVPMKV